MRLVADIGGTNSRLALAAGGMVLSETLRSYANDSYGSFEDFANAILSDVSTNQLGERLIAVVGLHKANTAPLINCDR